MKHINDDAEFSDVTRINNELNEKKILIEKEISEIELRLSTGIVPMDEDHIDRALRIEPGQDSDENTVEFLRKRHTTLRGQLDQVAKAIRHHTDKIDIAMRNAGYRVIACNSADYIKQGKETLKLVEQIIENNKSMREKVQKLYGRGCAETPILEFPAYGLTEQLPVWRDDMREQIRRLEIITKTYS